MLQYLARATVAEFFIGLLLGIVIGWLSIWCYLSPLVARYFARSFAVVVLSIGVGLLTWGIISAVMGGRMGELRLGSIAITHPSEAIGWGTGALFGGTTIMVLSFLGRSRAIPGEASGRLKDEKTV
jgi:hypothetical protein